MTDVGRVYRVERLFAYGWDEAVFDDSGVPVVFSDLAEAKLELEGCERHECDQFRIAELLMDTPDHGGWFEIESEVCDECRAMGPGGCGCYEERGGAE